MKINKRTIIILIVVAVAVFLLWKRKGTIVESETIAVSGGSNLDPTDLEDVITAAQINNTLAAKVREKAAAAQAMASVKDTIQSKADEKRNTYAQQVLFEALYPVYHKKDGDVWVIKSNADATAWKAIIARVKAM